MAILVTGGAGYIGSHTVVVLLESGFDVVVLDNLSNSSVESLSRVKNISGRDFKIYIGSVLDDALLHEIFRDNDITDVIHFAGLKSVGQSLKTPLDYYRHNISGTISLVENMHKAGVRNLIFSSSATVYGEPQRIPLNEECNIGGTTNPYGTSKLMIEQILRDFSKSDPQFRVTVLRYFNPVGAHPSGLIGESPHGIPNNILPYITQVAIGKLECLSVFGNDYSTKDGTGVRDYIHVMDLAQGHLAALANKNNGENYKVFNLGLGKGYSVLDLIRTFEKITKVNIKYMYVSRRGGDIAECWSDSSLAKQQLGWQAKYDLDDMIADSWKWQRLNPNGYE
ncbi:UDP-glucose 4-epimerase GalE [Pectobacterium versatile]|uniref:UDP-glucose 4-epimerase GalE n=1 Tax=Pectobacterium versatile TaxID=2488639 RepID=UPI000C7F52B0|nr:UDP-glucose 4-epimerase GalE [Pectobacterium versatile]MCA6914337.1 UDP-glucose 4-epimerase GalE [Pectobacterium versatile]PLY38640.1 UDP-glucose 4-epimerase GalE [Pectobacterium carotovorum]